MPLGATRQAAVVGYEGQRDCHMTTIYSAWILERSFGGLGVAVSPNSEQLEGSWPDGPSSPMSREATNALISACNGDAGADDPRCMVFLVGGAGNGKSKLAADTVNAVKGKFVGEERAFAQRTYAYKLKSGGCLRIINDATIPPADRHATPLVRDLAETMRARDHLLACINRGVLIGEIDNTEPSGGDPEMWLASSIVNWLLSGEIAKPVEAEFRIARLDEATTPDHYTAAAVYFGDIERTVIHVVYMDRVSLLENWTETGQFPGDYKLPLPSNEINVTPILSEDRQSRASAFEDCLSGAARAYSRSTEFDSLDPIGANAQSLSCQRVARGWCSLIRGAEVISGTHFTYRELWALFAHSVVGPVTSDGLGSLADWVQMRLVQAKTSSSEEQLSALLELGTLRTHMLLFDAGWRLADPSGKLKGHAWPRTVSEALKSTHLADPLRHFGPFGGAEAARLAEQLASIEEGHLPGDRLSAKDKDVAAYWTGLDAEIEKVIRDEVDPRNDTSSLKKRNWLLGWYGRYMHRLVGLARGWPAHCTVVHDWQNAWLDANWSQRLAPELNDAILDIVVPSPGQGAETFFTFMQPRVDAGEVAGARTMIALQRNKFELEAQTKGDRVEIKISQGGLGDLNSLPAAVAALDFHLLREASARSNGHGFTDSLMLIEPRVERIRASIVAHQLSLPVNQHRFKFSRHDDDVITR